MACAAEEDPGATLRGFARILADTDADVFGSKDDVLAIFDAADEEFWNLNEPTLLVSPLCTYDGNNPCWAVSLQLAWNDLFNHRGVELIQLQKGTLHFRTLNVEPDDLCAEDDVKFLCLYLWLLRQHRCISGVVLSIPVAAPRHGSLFLSLLKLTEFVEKCEIHGNDLFRAPCLGGSEPWITALDSLSRLRELGLSTVHLIDHEVTTLAKLVETNAFLVALVLIDVEMSLLAFSELVTKVVEHKKLQDFRIKMTTKEPQSIFTEALSLIGRSLTITRLYVHVDHGLVSLLQGLVGNSSLYQLTLEPIIHDGQVLHALADFLENNVSCKRLKACFDTRKLLSFDCALDDMQRIVGKSSLVILVLSGSVLAPLPVNHLAEGLAVSRTLCELHVDECELMPTEGLSFVKALKRRLVFGRFKELNLGALDGEPEEQLLLFRHIVEAGVCDRVTVVFNDCLVMPLCDALRWNSRLVNVSISYDEEIDIEPILLALKNTARSLESLCVSTLQNVGKLGGHFLAQLIRSAKSLKVVRLRCYVVPSAAVLILKALARSRSVLLLTIEHWEWTASVRRAFADMLQLNRSLYRLEFYWNDLEDFDVIKGCLTSALSFNLSVSVVKVYHGPELEEAAAHDCGFLPHVQRNEMILAWAAEVILRDGMWAEAAAVVELLHTCEAPLDLLQRIADISPRTATKRIHVARMATRTHFYALSSAFRGEPEFVLTSLGQRLFQDLLIFVRHDVLKAVAFIKPPSMDLSACD
ncbi:uncharacterized protein [Dermacentor albipictus]|uniref:uncharacterized protein n=1 Tax=Dermacentor albipictus TaxID=60249 RepID=UPI0031FC9EE9